MSELRVIDPDSPQLRESARLMLRRHEELAPEADVRREIANFLVASGLAAHDEIRMEKNRIDLQTGDFVIEVKKRIGTGINPNPKWVSQLDGYLRERVRAGESERLGVLTDGRYWILRQSGIEEVRTASPYGPRHRGTGGRRRSSAGCLGHRRAPGGRALGTCHLDAGCS